LAVLASFGSIFTSVHIAFRDDDDKISRMNTLSIDFSGSEGRTSSTEQNSTRKHDASLAATSRNMSWLVHPPTKFMWYRGMRYLHLMENRSVVSTLLSMRYPSEATSTFHKWTRKLNPGDRIPASASCLAQPSQTIPRHSAARGGTS
jgi:hypothetical protein